MSLTRKASSAAKKPMKPLRPDLAGAPAEREAELAEALSQQAATAEILRVISRSPTDAAPVFEAILEAGQRLFGSDEIGVYTIGDDDMVRVAAWRGPRAEEVRRDVTPLAESVTGRIIRERRTHHIADLRAEPNLSPTVRERVERLGSASLLYAPMLWEDRGLGSILVARSPPRAFSDREQALLQTFADQAAIAIENARLFRETQESLRQQTATSDILRVIASSPGDLQPVLDRLAETTCRLCGAYDALILLREGDDLRIAAHYGPIPLPAHFVKRPISRDWPPGRAVADRKTVHVPDLAAAQDEYPVAVSFSKDAVRTAAPRLAWRTALATPLMREGEPVGAIVLRRAEVWPFAEAQIALLQTFADQAVIAIQNARLFDEVQARTRDLTEALQQQTATADVLKVISRSAFDLKKVLETLLDSAVALCGAHQGLFLLRDGDEFRFEASNTTMTPEAIQYLKANPQRAGRHSVSARAIASGQIESAPDVLEDGEILQHGRVGQFAATIGQVRGVVAVPLVRDGRVEGVMVLSRPTPGPFSRKQIELLQTFADQALIAIENVRLFDEVQARTRDLTEALQQQTATADVLKVVSRSTLDLQPVLDTLVKTVARLCDAEMALILRRDGDLYRAGASVGFSQEYAEFLQSRPISVDHGTVTGRAVLERRTVQIADVMVDPEYILTEALTLTGQRTALGVPLIRAGEVIGVFVLARRRVEPFTQRQIELVTTFADQAVIAINNVDMFHETQEALRQQTATADVLKVISRSAFDLDVVFDALLTSAVSLLGSRGGTICVRDGDVFPYRAVAEGRGSAMWEYLSSHPATPGRASVAGRVLLSGKPEIIADTLLDGDFKVPVQSLAGSRSVAGVPLLRDDKVEGALMVGRAEAGPFDSQQIELLQTFADQAVIAIENARLFEEVQARTRDVEEALQQQTATADVLKVISRSAFDLRAVLDTLVASAAKLCDADQACVFQRQGDLYRWVSNYGFPPELVAYAEAHPLAPGPGSTTSRVALEGRTIHNPDVLADPNYVATEYRRLGNYRTNLGVPLLREGAPIGVFVLTRQQVRPFTERQVELVTTFADQAVIAIENVRLFDEVQARTRDLSEALQQQTATADVLKAISRSAFDLQAVLDTLIRSAGELCDAANGVVYLQQGEAFHLKAHAGLNEDLVRYLKQNPQRPGRGSGGARVLLTGAIQNIPDVQMDADYDPELRANATRTRALLGVPLMGSQGIVGAIVLTRPQPGAFTQRQIEIVQTFADQAVIAIENVRLFDQVQARTKELAASLDDLRKAQDRLIQSEKLASLGQLTAGIAHEIKNPLNFVNNFSALSRELVGELADVIKAAPLDDARREEAEELIGTIDGNLDKVVQHGKRADSIVKNMLLHSREGSGERSPTNVNTMVEEALNLAYHGARAEKPGFNVTIVKSLDPNAGEAEVYAQEMTRVLLNLISNGFYATAKRKQAGADEAYEPTLTASTRDLGTSVEIAIRDNGTGIPDEVRAKMFNPFFTTKPAGEGTGLGLSLSHDIVVKQHGGTIEVSTEPGGYTEFTIVLPRKNGASDAS